MQRFTKEAVEAGRELWEQLDEDVSDADFVKSAAVRVLEQPVWTGPRIPDGHLIKIADQVIAEPRHPGADAPAWAVREYDEQVKTAMVKLAGFWGEAFKNLTTTLKSVIRGGGRAVPGSAKDILDVAQTGTHGERAIVDIAKLEGLFKGTGTGGMSGFQKAQVGLALALPAAAIAGGAKAWSAGQRVRQHGRVERALVNDPEFENQADKEQAISESYGLMRKYSPSIALDPVVSKSFVKLLVSMPDMQNIEVVQNLMEAEKKFQDSQGFTTDLRDIQKLVKHPLVTPFTGGGGKKS